MLNTMEYVDEATPVPNFNYAAHGRVGVAARAVEHVAFNARRRNAMLGSRFMCRVPPLSLDAVEVRRWRGG